MPTWLWSLLLVAILGVAGGSLFLAVKIPSGKHTGIALFLMFAIGGVVMIYRRTQPPRAVKPGGRP